MMDSLEIENIEKLLQELEANSNLLLIDDGLSPKQFQPNKSISTNHKTKSSNKDNLLLNSYEFLNSLDVLEFSKAKNDLHIDQPINLERKNSENFTSMNSKLDFDKKETSIYNIILLKYYQRIFLKFIS